MHSLHHPHILRELFDYEQYSIPRTENRPNLHKKLASDLREKKEVGKGKTGSSNAKGGTIPDNTDIYADMQPYESVIPLTEMASMPSTFQLHGQLNDQSMDDSTLRSTLPHLTKELNGI